MKTHTFLPLLLVVASTLSQCRAFLPSGATALGRLPPADGSPLFLRGGGLSTKSRNKQILFSGGTTSKVTKRRSVDWSALLKYTVGMAVQLSLVFSLFAGLDQLLARTSVQIPFALNLVFFYLFNSKTGTFSPLKPRRNDNDNKSGFGRDKVRPKWTPPGFVFAIMWPLFVFGIRATTASMIVDVSAGRYATAPLMSLFAHLAFGNLWNTVNNVEGRLGFAVPVLYGLLGSNLYASFRFYQVKPLAGKLLALTSTWLAAAAALETRTWQLNPDKTTEKLEPLYPAKDPRWNTKFRWE